MVYNPPDPSWIYGPPDEIDEREVEDVDKISEQVYNEDEFWESLLIYERDLERDAY